MRAWRGLVHLFVCVLPVPAWAPGTAARSSTCEQLDVWIYCMGEPAMGGNGEWRRGTNREQRDPCPLAWLRRDQSTTKAKPIAKQRGGTDRAVDGGLHARNAEMPTGTALVVCGGVWSLTACGLLSLCLA